MRDLTADDMPILGLLTDEERGMLVAEIWDGKVQEWINGDWQLKTDYAVFPAIRYRIKPEPRKPREWWILEFEDGSFTVFFQKPPYKAAKLVREVINND